MVRPKKYWSQDTNLRMNENDDRDLGELCRRLRSLLQEDSPCGGLLQVSWPRILLASLRLCLQAVTKLEKLSVTLAEENMLRTSSPLLRTLASPSPSPHLVEALVESPLYEKVNCRVRLIIDSGPGSWDGQVIRHAKM